MTNRFYAVPVILWIAGISLVFFLGQREQEAELERLMLETRITAEQVQLRLESCVRSRVALVRTLSGSDWRDGGDVERRWRQRAQPLIGLFPGVQALNFVDPDSTIRIVVPEAANRAAVGGFLLGNPNPSVVSAFNRATTGVLARTDPIELLQSGTGFTLYDRIESTSGETLGYANGVFRINDLMETCLAERRFAEGFQLALYELGETQPFFTKPDRTSTRPWANAEQIEVEVADRPWQMIVAHNPLVMPQTNRETETLILFFGVSLVTLVSFLAWLLLSNQRSLRESQQRFRFIVENQSDFVIQLDPDNRLLYASPSFADSQGRVASELIGTSFLDVLAEDGSDTMQTIREQLRSDQHSVEWELQTITTRGNRWIDWSFSGVLDESGNLEFVNGTGRDLTDLRLLEDRIAHTEKMKALGEMAGGITHDFNNLLQVMLGNIEFLVKGAKGDEREQLEQVESAILRAMNLTGKLATLSRQHRVDRRQVDLAGFTGEVANLLRHTLPTTITVQFEAPEEPVHVSADPAQIEQVLLNLAFNAKDSIDNYGSIRIAVGTEILDASFCRTHPEIEPGHYARVSVVDDGAGIPPDVLPRIFDPFFTTKGIGDGHGLGLSNCDSIVRQHGGIILADSEADYGSTFTVYLPVAEALVDSTVETASMTSSAPSKNRVLLVDDNEDVLKLTQRILASAGYQTITATNGHDGVVMFEEHQHEISMVIMDLVMPVMDGREAAARIRALAPGIYILFSSGYVPMEDEQTVGLDGPLLRKPFKSRELLDYVAEAMGPSADT